MVNLKKLFLYWGAVMLIALVLFAILGPKGKKIDLKEIDFYTTQSAALYFKNMRSYFYDQEELNEGNYVLYRIDSRMKDSVQNKLNGVIVQNKITDDSFIRFETGMLDIDQQELNVSWKLDDSTGIISLNGMESYHHFLFAAELFEKLDAEAKVSLMIDEKEIPFTEKEKKSLRKSLYDYFRLVGKLR